MLKAIGTDQQEHKTKSANNQQVSKLQPQVSVGTRINKSPGIEKNLEGHEEHKGRIELGSRAGNKRQK